MHHQTCKPFAASEVACGASAERRESLCEVFHENTKYSRARFLAEAEQATRHLRSLKSMQAMSRNFKVYRFSEKCELPQPGPLAMPLAETLRRRVSTRVFSGEAVPLDVLAAVLLPAAACNRCAVARDFPSVTLHFRSYPSGGGEYPVEIYPILLRVAGLTPRVTHFDPVNARLSCVSEPLSPQTVAECLMRAGAALDTAAVLFVLTAVFERSTGKYGDRGYRLAMLEAGHLAQNLCLTAAAAGLGSLAWGGFYDDEINRLIEVDGVNEASIHMLFVGGVRP